MINKIRNFFILISLPIVFFGCGTSSTTQYDINTIDYTAYSNANFSILYPNDWEIIERGNFPSSVSNDVIVVFKNNIKSEIFTANLSLAIGISDQKINTKDFALNTLEKAKVNLIDFVELNQSEDSVKSGTTELPAYVAQFSGKKQNSSPKIIFTQLYVAKDKVIYTLTAAYQTNEDESIVKKVNDMLNSFSLK